MQYWLSKNYKKEFLMKKAFTMIELIFVIVILGVVAYVATGMIAKTYISYNRVNTLHKANIKVETALNNIAKRLSYAIGGTIIKRMSGAQYNIAPIELAPQNYSALEWIGYDVDGFVANNAQAGTITPRPQPAWSGFVDLTSTNRINNNTLNIVTPGSDLAFEGIVLNNLSSNVINRNTLANVALFFPGNFNYRNVGYAGPALNSNSSGVAVVTGINTANNPNSFTVNAINPFDVAEYYKLAWSAYAVVPSDDSANPQNPCGNYRNTRAGQCNANNPCNLCLVYNYRPWLDNGVGANAAVNQYYSNNNNIRANLLVSNVTVFKTYARANRVHIKLCVKEQYAMGANSTTSICKEKVVFR